jgi:cytochrome c oxidase subunit 3
MYFHSYEYGFELMLLGFLLIICIMYVWWRDVIRESTYLGYHTKVVVAGLQLGMILFILSEAMFFFSFFWAFFHSSISPSIFIGSVWPPKGIETLDPFRIPLLNTLILLTSGLFVTISHYNLCIQKYNNNKYSNIFKYETFDINFWKIKIKKNVLFDKYYFLVDKITIYEIPFKYFLSDKFGKLCLFITILLAIEFTFWQWYEYKEAFFCLYDGIFGSTFFMTTGFHGLHVLIGTVFLIVALYRWIQNHFSYKHHFGFEAAIWYWHFVDVVWLFLYIFVYCWGTL